MGASIPNALGFFQNHAGQENRGRHWRFHLPAFRHHGSDGCRLQPRKRYGCHSGQQHHRHDRASAKPCDRPGYSRQPCAPDLHRRYRKGLWRQKMWIVDAYDMSAGEAALREALAAREPAVIIARRPCILILRNQVREACEIDQSACKLCRSCLKIGCPAIEVKDGKVRIAAKICTGCGVCLQICKFNAIRKAGEVSV